VSKKFDPRAARNVAVLVFVPVVVVALFSAFNLRINYSASHVNVGIWKAFPPVPVNVGDVVTYDKDEFFAACPQIREDRMKFRSPVVIKRVAATAGALVELSGDLVVVNGRLYPEARIIDDSWRKVEYPLLVPLGTVWLMADSKYAYDSRYHGPLPIFLVREKLEPVLVW